MIIQNEKRFKIKLMLNKQKSALGKYKENLEPLYTQQTLSKKNLTSTSIAGTSQFSTILSKKLTRQNAPSNLYSTLMKTKFIQAKSHCLGSNSNKNSNADLSKITKMNLTSKHSMNTSLDMPERYTNNNRLVEALKKENSELALRLKEQEKTISEIFAQKKTLESKCLSLEKKKRVLIDEIDALKANENQLITVLYVLEEKGVPIEQIIDKWNAENEPTNRSLDSAAFTPITLEKSPKCLTKIENIPKLNFSSIKAISLRKIKQTKKKEKQFNCDYVQCIENIDSNEEGNNDNGNKKQKRRCHSQHWSGEEGAKMKQKMNQEEVKNIDIY